MEFQFVQAPPSSQVGPNFVRRFFSPKKITRILRKVMKNRFFFVGFDFGSPFSVFNFSDIFLSPLMLNDQQYMLNKLLTLSIYSKTYMRCPALSLGRQWASSEIIISRRYSTSQGFQFSRQKKSRAARAGACSPL